MTAGPDSAGLADMAVEAPLPHIDDPTQPVPAVPSQGRARYRRRRRVRAAVSVGVALALLGAAGVAARGLGGREAQRPAHSRLPPSTARVERATLTQTERISGTFGYGKTTTVVARQSATSSGGDGPQAGGAAPSPSPTPSASPAPIPTTNTLTWLPAVGAVVRPGQPMFKVDNRSVVLIAGDTPPYRVLTTGAGS